MPRTPRNPGSGKRPHNGPARGAGHGYGKGQWGGEAKGASTSRIKPGDPDGIQAMSNDPAKIAAREERLRVLKDHLFGLALGAEREETQLSATVAFLNREEGMPVQRNVNVNTDDLGRMTDAELEAHIADLEARLREGAGGSASPDGAPGPDGVVH